MATSNNLVQSEVLFFILGTIDAHPASMIKKSVLEFYREDEIMSAKYLLVQAVEQMKDIPLLTYVRQRKGENKVRVTVDNLINIICEVDKAGQRDSLPTFCAVQRSRIPVLVDEVSDIAAMQTEISQLRERFDVIATQMNELMHKQSVEGPALTKTVDGGV